MAENQRTRNIVITCFATYCVQYLCWSAWTVYVVPEVASIGGFHWLETFLKCVIWVTPFLVAAISNKDCWLESPGRVFCASFPFVPLLAMLCATVCFLYTLRVVNGLQNTFALWNWHYLLFSLSAGITEEIAFRGFIFNRMANPLGVIPAALVNGAIFAIYHYPEVIMRFQFVGIFSLRFVMLYAVGVLFCMAFAKWRNLWLTIIVHSVWNLISYLWALAG